VVEYMREHASYYKQFIAANHVNGDEPRRNPKRKNAGAYLSAATPAPPPSAEDIEGAFQRHVVRMAEDGVYGGNMEIHAFSAAYDVDVVVYQKRGSIPVSAEGTGVGRRTAYLAYHVGYPFYSFSQCLHDTLFVLFSPWLSTRNFG
jgi:hypothetical protein